MSNYYPVEVRSESGVAVVCGECERKAKNAGVTGSIAGNASHADGFKTAAQQQSCWMESVGAVAVRR